MIFNLLRMGKPGVKNKTPRTTLLGIVQADSAEEAINKIGLEIVDVIRWNDETTLHSIQIIAKDKSGRRFLLESIRELNSLEDLEL